MLQKMQNTASFKSGVVINKYERGIRAVTKLRPGASSLFCAYIRSLRPRIQKYKCLKYKRKENTIYQKGANYYGD